jgi:uncharacterized CHY-type Zn-finger protein
MAPYSVRVFQPYFFSSHRTSIASLGVTRRPQAAVAAMKRKRFATLPIREPEDHSRCRHCNATQCLALRSGGDMSVSNETGAAVQDERRPSTHDSVESLGSAPCRSFASCYFCGKSWWTVSKKKKLMCTRCDLGPLCKHCRHRMSNNGGHGRGPFCPYCAQDVVVGDDAPVAAGWLRKLTKKDRPPSVVNV